MSDLDLTAAIEAGKVALETGPNSRWLTLPGPVHMHGEMAQRAVTAAAPLIREQIARAIEDQRDHDDYPNNEVASVAATAYSNAARIARGES